MKLIEKDFGVIAVLEVLKVKERDSNVKMKKGRYDNKLSLEVTGRFKYGVKRRLAEAMDFTPTTAATWCRGMSEKERGFALNKLWEKGYIEIHVCNLN